jgi:Domain of unknown function (DUF1906)
VRFCKRRSCTICLLSISALPLVLLGSGRQVLPQAAKDPSAPPKSIAYLGFDANEYPGDVALPILKRTFSFAGYWLNNPPGENWNSWRGKRAVLLGDGFGFLVLFNGRLERALKNPARATALGSRDARDAVELARREGFLPGTILFIDQEEGGEMEPEQMAYLLAWFDEIIDAGFRAGAYCSGMPASAGAGRFVTTADDIRNHAGDRSIAYFVYNDACPPSPGCAYSETPPPPSASGVVFASVWQFAQSPRRKSYTAHCAASYNRDGNCYPPGFAAKFIFIDVESAASPDPSNGGS